jgi:long-chain acyl-CoA synthetase
VSQQPARAQYDPGVRASLAPYPQRTLLDYLADAVRERPDHVAVMFKGRTLTCAELDRLSDAFGAALVSLGVRKGDRVALVLPNSPQFMIAELGAWKTGATVVPLNPMYTEHELQDALSQTGAEIIVALTPFVARVKACQSRTRVRLVIATNIKEYLPPFKQVLFTLFRERSGGHRIRLGPGDLWFRDLLRAQANARRPKVDVRP